MCYYFFVQKKKDNNLGIANPSLFRKPSSKEVFYEMWRWNNLQKLWTKWKEMSERKHREPPHVLREEESLLINREESKEEENGI